LYSQFPPPMPNARPESGVFFLLSPSLSLGQLLFP
jgi:hypothetical protein